MADERLDLVIFGATGYTGKFAVKYAVHFCKKQQMKFGVAGRKKEALEAVVKEFDSNNGDVPIILADVKDEESLKKMTERAKVLINCCGPFRLYGEAVVKACIATQTHHVDVSGEPEYMERMQLEYNKAAQDAGVYIVSACGFDSIPADLGIIFAQKKFEGEVNTVETYVTFDFGGTKGGVINYGTWETAVYSLTHADNLRALRQKLYPEKLPTFTPKLKYKSVLHQSDISEGWSTVFQGSDRSVVLRTQRFLYDKYKERPAQVQTYITFKSFFTVVMYFIFGAIFILMARMSSFTSNLLLKFPGIFSLGLINREGPNPEMLEHTSFSIKFRTLGWNKKLDEPTDRHTDPPNKELITKVSGASPAYGATSIMLILSAITILKESDKMPDSGGVLSPGAAFGKTSLIEELIKNDIKFEVISSTEILKSQL